MQLTDLQKKILYSALLIIVAIGMAIIIYIVFFKAPKEELINVNGELVPESIFPEINANVNQDIDVSNTNAFNGVPTIDSVARGSNTLTDTLTDESASDMTLSANGKDVQYYNSEDGKFYRINELGEKIAMSDEIFKGVNNVTWSNSSQSAVLEFDDDYNLFYDFEKKKQYTVPKEMEQFTFSPTDDQIGFKYMAIDKEDRWLGVMDPDGSNPRGLEKLGDNADKIEVNWSPSGKAVGTFNEYIDGNRQRVIPIGLNSENFKQMTVEGRGFEYAWSPTGKQMLYNVFGSYSDYQPTLWIVDAEGEQIGENRTALEMNTWVDKCTFSSKTQLYCAVPQTLPTGAGYARDVADNIPDNIYKIDLATGKKELMAIPINAFGTEQYTINNMQVSDDGATLFFTDVQQNNIHKLKLK
ncbi:MAG: hypothetical protein V1898_03645 [Patescibacteria group bacterium]